MPVVGVCVEFCEAEVTSSVETDVILLVVCGDVVCRVAGDVASFPVAVEVASAVGDDVSGCVGPWDVDVVAIC